MKKELTVEEIHLLARVKSIEVNRLLRVKELLDPIRVRRYFILNEYKQKIKRKIYTKQQVISLLMQRYDVSRSYVESIIYNKSTSKSKQCVRCGAEMTHYRWNKNDGVCDNCIEEYDSIGDI